MSPLDVAPPVRDEFRGRLATATLERSSIGRKDVVVDSQCLRGCVSWSRTSKTFRLTG